MVLYGWFFQNHGCVSYVEWKMMVSSVLPPNRNLVVSSNQDSDGVFHQTEIWSCNLFNLYSKKNLVLISTWKIMLLVFSPKNTCWWCFSSKTTFSIFKKKFGFAQIWCAPFLKDQSGGLLSQLDGDSCQEIWCSPLAVHAVAT